MVRAFVCFPKICEPRHYIFSDCCSCCVTKQLNTLGKNLHLPSSAYIRAWLANVTLFHSGQSNAIPPTLSFVCDIVRLQTCDPWIEGRNLFGFSSLRAP